MSDSMKVLLVEDNPGDVRLVQEVLSRGSEVSMRTVGRLSEALTELDFNGIDVVLLDLSLPDSSGLDTFLSLRRQYAEVPVVILTGLQDESVGVSALQTGAQDYLIKGEINSRLLGRTLRYAVERSRAEQRYHNLANRMKSLLESTTEGIFAVSPAGECLLINRAAQEMLGYTAEEVVGKDMHELIHGDYADGSNDSAEECQLQHSLRTSESCRGTDEVLFRRDGVAFPIDYSASPIRQENRISGVVVTFNDITDRMLLQDQLEQERRVSSLGRVAATIAHEFNNVLMGIQPFAEFLERGEHDEIVVRSAARIRKSADRGRRIVQGILRFARPAEPTIEALLVASWLEDITPEIRSLVGPAIQVVNEVDDPSLKFLGDASQLAQVLTNLATNARDVMAGGGELCIRVSTPSSSISPLIDPAASIQISVSDTGPGMAPEILEKIFEPLFTTKREGMGLGLAVVHSIILRHGGKILVRSEPGCGTTFDIFLRRALAADRVASNKRGEPKDGIPTGARILVVEDDQSVASGVEALLILEGAEVEIAATGADAEERIETFCPHLVIVDIGLPDIDGIELYRALRRRFTDLPLVLSSGHGDMVRIHEELGEEVEFLFKPYSADEMYQVLSRSLHRS